MTITNQNIMKAVTAQGNEQIRQDILDGNNGLAFQALTAETANLGTTPKKVLTWNDFVEIIGLTATSKLMGHLQEFQLVLKNRTRMALEGIIDPGTGLVTETPARADYTMSARYKVIIDLLSVSGRGVDFSNPEFSAFLTYAVQQSFINQSNADALLDAAVNKSSYDVDTFGEALTKDRFREFVKWLKPKFRQVPSGPVNVAVDAAPGTLVWNLAANVREPANRPLSYAIVSQTVPNALAVTAGGQLQVNSNSEFPNRVGAGDDSQRIAALVRVSNNIGFSITGTITLNITN